MKITSTLTVFFAAILIATGQGTFLYDQQSASNGISSGGVSINEAQPLGQAFTASLSAVGFVQLQLNNGFNLTNATIAVNLWGGSLSGTLLGTSEPLALSAGYFALATTFRFGSPVTLTPGSTYYFQPVIQSGGNNDWFLGVDLYDYPGDFFYQGIPQSSGLKFWFREGVIVPEPSATVLLGLGLGVLFYARRVKIKGKPLL